MYVASYTLNLILLCSADLINLCTITGTVQLTQKGSTASEKRSGHSLIGWSGCFGPAD